MLTLEAIRQRGRVTANGVAYMIVCFGARVNNLVTPIRAAEAAEPW